MTKKGKKDENILADLRWLITDFCFFGLVKLSAIFQS